MSWAGDLRQQIREAFRDAQRRPGEIETDARAPMPLSPATAVEKPDTRRRARRFVTTGALS